MNSAAPLLIEPQMLPSAAPDWADEFGGDEYGIYCRFRISDVWFVLRWIPPGEFTMGSPESDTGRDSDEGPQHRVVISQGFWLGETPVTQQQWRAVVQAAVASELPARPSHFKDKPQHPVESVNWHQSVQFCQQVQAVLQSAQQFRLPTEAEWEYACRAGTSGAFHDGSPCTEP
ncbi:MAG: formylglycine-generating enzyme family protein, partial [Planctomyces sp.]